EHLPLRNLFAHPRGHQARGAEGRLTMAGVSRREFLVAAASGGGLLLAFHYAGSRALAAAANAAETGVAPNAFVRIRAERRVNLIVSQVEMGQGTFTSMPMLLCEELEVGLDQVHLEQAPPDEKRYALPGFGMQVTGASTSVKLLQEPLRRAGAVARVMLI